MFIVVKDYVTHDNSVVYWCVWTTMALYVTEEDVIYQALDSHSGMCVSGIGSLLALVFLLDL